MTDSSRDLENLAWLQNMMYNLKCGTPEKAIKTANTIGEIAIPDKQLLEELSGAAKEWRDEEVCEAILAAVAKLEARMPKIEVKIADGIPTSDVNQEPKSPETSVADKMSQPIENTKEVSSEPLPEDIPSPSQQGEDEKKQKTGLPDSSGTRWNTYAIAGLCLGIASVFLYTIGILSILTIIFSVIGLKKSKEYGGIGKFQAGIGLVLGIIYTLLYLRDCLHF